MMFVTGKVVMEAKLRGEKVHVGQVMGGVLTHTNRLLNTPLY